MTAPRLLVAGIGNIFLGDDAFGVEVAQRLAPRPMAEGVRVVGFGIRGLDLAYALLDPYEAVILIDALPRGESPGTLCVFEPEPPTDRLPQSVRAHNLDPASVQQLVKRLGGPRQRVLVVGCEPTPCSDDEEMMTMSDAVRSAVDEAVTLVESLIARLLANDFPDPSTDEEVLKCHPWTCRINNDTTCASTATSLSSTITAGSGWGWRSAGWHLLDSGSAPGEHSVPIFGDT